MSKVFCLNCKGALSEEKYCPNCGKKVTKQDLSFRFLFKAFLETFTNFDMKLFRSFRDVWVPNKINLNFLAGNRDEYVNHLRFLFICLIIFFGLLSLNLKKSPLNGLDATIAQQAANQKIQADFDSLSLEYLNIYPDTLVQIRKDLFAKKGSSISGEFFEFNDIKMSAEEAYYAPIDTLMQKYKINGRAMKIIFPHILKSYRSSGSMSKFMIGNMLWGFPLVTIIVAMFLKLLYIRHQSYYVEHVLHLVNFHSIFLILSAILLIIELFNKGEFDGSFYNLAFLFSGFHLTYSLKKYYNESWWKSLTKGFFILIFYVFTISVVVFLIVSISVLLF